MAGSLRNFVPLPSDEGGINDPPRAEQLAEVLAKIADLVQKVAGHFGVADLSTSAKSPAMNGTPPRA